MTYTNFKISEFACPCCGENETQHELIEGLDRAVNLAGVPFVISSGYRCEKHNERVGGIASSSHLRGLAADSECLTSKARMKMVKALLDVGFDRIGISSNFIHVDVDRTKPPGVIWTY